MATRAALLAWAQKQIGTVESGGPHGNDGNVVCFWDQIHHHEEQGCSWCAAFVEAGEEAVGAPVVVDSQFCPYVESAYRKAGRLTSIDRAQPGDQVFFHFQGEPIEANHTGIVESIDAHAKTVTAIEGNTSAGGGSQSNGGGVYRKTRPWSEVRSVGQPVFDPSVPAGAVTSTGMPVLGGLARGPYVKVWKQMLVNKASMHLTVDDGFDQATVDATKAFQKMAGIDDDGKVGAATWAAMLKLAA